MFTVPKVLWPVLGITPTDKEKICNVVAGKDSITLSLWVDPQMSLFEAPKKKRPASKPKLKAKLKAKGVKKRNVKKLATKKRSKVLGGKNATAAKV